MSQIIPYNRNLKPYATRLRNNMTVAEKILWSQIKSRKLFDLQFCRQFQIGSYIVDFYCKPIKLAIEVDGPIHLTVEGLDSDKNRDFALSGYNIKVLRFTNDQVINDLKNVI